MRKEQGVICKVQTNDGRWHFLLVKLYKHWITNGSLCVEFPNGRLGFGRLTKAQLRELGYKTEVQMPETEQERVRREHDEFMKPLHDWLVSTDRDESNR